MWQLGGHIIASRRSVAASVLRSCSLCRAEEEKILSSHSYIRNLQWEAGGNNDTVATTSILNIHNRRGWPERLAIPKDAHATTLLLFPFVPPPLSTQNYIWSMRQICNSVFCMDISSDNVFTRSVTFTIWNSIVNCNYYTFSIVSHYF